MLTLRLLIARSSNCLHVGSDHNCLRNAGCARLVHDKQHPVPRDDDAGVIGDVYMVATEHRHTPLEMERNTTLVGVDGVGSAAEADQGGRCDAAVGVEFQFPSDFDGIGQFGGDLGTRSFFTILCQEIRWREDLGVVVVGGAVAAETAAAVQDSAVGQQD